MIDFVEDDDEDTATLVHASNEFTEDSVCWPAREWDLADFMGLQQRITKMAQHPVLGVDLTAVDHDCLNGPVEFSTFRFKFITDIRGHCSFSCAGDSVQGHVGRDVAVESFDKVE